MPDFVIAARRICLYPMLCPVKGPVAAASTRKKDKSSSSEESDSEDEQPAKAAPSKPEDINSLKYRPK